MVRVCKIYKVCVFTIILGYLAACSAPFIFISLCITLFPLIFFIFLICSLLLSTFLSPRQCFSTFCHSFFHFSGSYLHSFSYSLLSLFIHCSYLPSSYLFYNVSLPSIILPPFLSLSSFLPRVRLTPTSNPTLNLTIHIL